MARKKKTGKSKRVDSLKHKDKRKNIPTEELRGFVREDEAKAAKVAAARNLWVPAVNNHGGFGRWEFIEIVDPWNAKNVIKSFVSKLGGATE